MSEPLSSFDPEQFALQFQSRRPVQARWEFYGLDPKVVELHLKAVDTLKSLGMLPVEATVGEIGAANGSFMFDLSVLYGHTGQMWGVDRNSGSFNDREKELIVERPAWQRLQKLATMRGLELAVSDNAIEEYLSKPMSAVLTPAKNSHLLEGDAANLKALQHRGEQVFKNGSMDALFMFYMMYFMSEPARAKAYKEYPDILRPNGVLAITTSFDDNKRELYELDNVLKDGLERITGHEYKSPAKMIDGFTADKARVELPEGLPDMEIYEFEHEGTATVRPHEPRDREVTLDSIRSVRNLFDPVPSPELFERVIAEDLSPHLRRIINSPEGFKVKIHRGLYLVFKQKPPSRIEEMGFKHHSGA